MAYFGIKEVLFQNRHEYRQETVEWGGGGGVLFSSSGWVVECSTIGTLVTHSRDVREPVVGSTAVVLLTPPTDSLT
jgi:hypothetical protein